MKQLKFIFCLLFAFPLGAFSQNYYTISGIITDAQNGKLLEGINVVVENKSTGTLSNYKGAYLLYLDKGQYEISYSANGYKQTEVKVDLTSDFVQMVELTPKKRISRNKLLRKKSFLRCTKDADILSDITQPEEDNKQ